MTWHSFGEPVIISAKMSEMDEFFRHHRHWCSKLVSISNYGAKVDAFRHALGVADDLKMQFDWLNSNIGPMEVFHSNYTGQLTQTGRLTTSEFGDTLVKAHSDTRWFGSLHISDGPEGDKYYYAFQNEKEGALFKLFCS